MRPLEAIAVLLLAIGCAAPSPGAAPAREPEPLEDPRFKDYWFSGKAELTRYRLEQARYGEIHRGDAVLIFVTEDFLPDRQVKADSPDRSRTGALPVLKLNLTKKFYTGIYPYSIMTSVFTPLDPGAHPRTLKTTTSVQEWCGHTWLQLNLRGERYAVAGHSYFESEGDESFDLDAAWLEDEIWSRIRLAPATLPEGAVRIIPGGHQARLLHRRLAVEAAEASLSEPVPGEMTYRLAYPDAGRSLAIRFQKAFPHAILGWEETQRGGPGARELTTRAIRAESIQLDYWTRNHAADAPWREKLGL
jgi:hypothetical protein